MIEALKTNFDFFALLWVFGLHEDGDLVVFATDNAEVSGTQMHIDLAAGGKGHLERVTRQVGDFDLFGLGENKRGEENRKGEKADGVTHGHTPLLLPKKRSSGTKGFLYLGTRCGISRKRDCRPWRPQSGGRGGRSR